MSDKGHNGWTNYETWAVALWIDNEEGSQRYWRERALAALEWAKETPISPFTVEERAALSLREILKDEHEESLPSLEGFASDLLNGAMSEVNWYEIATHIVDNAK